MLNNLVELQKEIFKERNLIVVKECNGGSIIKYGPRGVYQENELDGKVESGVFISVEETYRRNGSSENQSIYISIARVEKHSSGCGTVMTLDKIKVYSKFTLNKQTKMINKIIDKYFEEFHK